MAGEIVSVFISCGLKAEVLCAGACHADAVAKNIVEYCGFFSPNKIRLYTVKLSMLHAWNILSTINY